MSIDFPLSLFFQQTTWLDSIPDCLQAWIAADISLISLSLTMLLGICPAHVEFRYQVKIYNQSLGFPLSGCLPEISHSLSICGSYLNIVFWILQASKTAGCLFLGFGYPMDGTFPQPRSCKTQEIHSVSSSSKWLLSSAFSAVIFYPEFMLSVEGWSNRSYSVIIRSRPQHIFFGTISQMLFLFWN